MNRAEFLQRRKSGIGGSDVAAVMGLSKWRTPLDVWHEKTATEPPEDEPNDVLELASYLEEYTASKYEKISGRTVRRRNSLLVSDKYPCLIGNIDREILHDERGLGILECKALSTFNFRKVEMNGLPNDYLLQGHHYHFCGNGKYKFVVFAILNRDNGKLLTFEIEIDPELQKRAADFCNTWWHSFVVPGVEPTAEADSLHKAPKLPATDGKIADMNSDADLAGMLKEYREWSNISGEAAEVLANVRSRIAEHLGNRDCVECSGMRLYYKASTHTTFDVTKFKKDNPVLYYKYAKTSETAKSLRFYEIANN